MKETVASREQGAREGRSQRTEVSGQKNKLNIERDSFR